LSDISIILDVFGPLFEKLIFSPLVSPAIAKNYEAVPISLLEEFETQDAIESAVLNECLKNKNTILDTVAASTLLAIASYFKLSEAQRNSFIKKFIPDYIPGNILWLTGNIQMPQSKITGFRFSFDFILPKELQETAQQLTETIANALHGKGTYDIQKGITVFEFFYDNCDPTGTNSYAKYAQPKINYPWTTQKHELATGKRVLIVEDNDSIRTHLKQILEANNSGLIITTTESLSEAYHMLREEKNKPDFISLDIMLLEELGIDLPFAMLKNQIPETPIIVVSDVAGSLKMEKTLELYPAVKKVIAKETIHTDPSLFYGCCLDLAISLAKEKPSNAK
jgi:CheY-like chemotaxis protein